MRQLRVDMAGTTITRFEISQWLGNLEFDIAQISSYDPTLNRVLLTIKRSEADIARRANRANDGSLTGAIKNMFSFRGSENRWLCLGANTDSKRFLLFLMEMYHKRFTGKDGIFCKATNWETIFQNPEGIQIVKEHIGLEHASVPEVNNGLPGIVHDNNLTEFMNTCEGKDKWSGSRRLV